MIILRDGISKTYRVRGVDTHWFPWVMMTPEYTLSGPFKSAKRKTLRPRDQTETKDREPKDTDMKVACRTSHRPTRKEGKSQNREKL